MQFLGPALKGMYENGWDLSLLFRNLSGINSNGFSQYFSLQWTGKTNKVKRVPAGNVFPRIFTWKH